MKITKLSPVTIPHLKRKRVAAYARVSIDTERLSHSLSAQVSYYSELIQKNPEWEYAGVFADYAVSGTGTAKRAEFNRLMEECEAGNVQIILTKSISRFARNTVDLLETVRHLKSIGVEVRFERENISTFSGDGELMLTILASFAQEESRSISENVKWGLRKRYKSGEIGIRNKKVFGYRYDGEKYVIEPEEAEAVRYIYRRYLEGAGYRTIARELAEMGIRSCRDYEISMNHVHYILTNDLYTGDLRFQKCYVTDPISKNKIKNRGELPQYYMSDCHTPIVDRETFNAVQDEHKRRSDAFTLTCFSGKILCCTCGARFTRKNSSTKEKRYLSWICRSKKEPGKTCASANFREDRLKEICCGMLQIDAFDPEYFTDRVREIDVLPSGDLEFLFYDGPSKIWIKPAKPPKPERKHRPVEHSCFDRMIYCAACGKRYGRTKTTVKSKACIMWRCRGKHSGDGGTCDSVNYTDEEIKRAYALVSGVESFDEENFTSSVERIQIGKTGNIEFHFKNGGIKVWENLKLRVHRHESTSTKAFIGKIRCGICGNEYSRYFCRDTYSYWYCLGRGRKVHCKNINYPDHALRKVSAYMMGMDDFNEEAFIKTVDSITVLENGKLEYRFTDGGIKTWAKML